MRTIRRHISIFLTTVMIFTFMPFSNLFKVESFAAQDGQCGVNAYWSISGSTLTISGTGAIYDYEPGTHGPWDDSGDTYTSIVIGSGITRIGEFAFHESPAASVSIPDTVTSIGTGAFASSALTSVTIPGSVESWQEAFVMCESLQTAEIMPGVTKIDVMSFGGCSNLENCSSVDGTFALPQSVTEICDCAFQYCESFCEIQLPKNVARIGSNAFEGCSNMYGMEFTKYLTEIGEDAFADADNIQEIHYHGTEDDWSSMTVETGNDILQSATVNYNRHYDYCTSSNSETHSLYCYFCDTTRTVPHDFFNGVCLVCNAVQSYENKCGDNAYWTIENGTLIISGTGDTYNQPEEGTNPWDQAQIEYDSIVIESGITSIGDYKFKNSPAQSVSIPDTVTYIGTGAFRYSALTSVFIPDSTQIIAPDAFSECYNLTDFEVSDTNPYWQVNDGVLFHFGSLFQYPFGRTDTYYQLPSDTNDVNAVAFYGNQYLTAIEVPCSLIAVGMGAFAGVSNLSDVYYHGSASDWINININEGNERLTNAEIHYGYHTFVNGACNYCGESLRYTIHFDPNGGTGTAMDDMQCTYNTNYMLYFNTFYRTGFTFKHWSTSADGYGEVYNDKQIISNLTSNHGETVTLFAIWEENTSPADTVALDEAMAKIPEIKTYYSDESVEALNAVLEEIYEGTENISEQELAELVERLNEALANLELKSYQITVPDGCTATQTEVDGVNYKLATITAPQQNANGEYFVYWTDDSGNIVSTYRTYSFYVGSSTSYTPVYASAQNYDSAKAAALITSRVIDVKNNGDGNLVFLAEHSVSSTKELNGHGMIITSNESFADEELLVRGSENEDIKDFMAQKTKNSKTGMLQVSANVSGNTIWARTYVIDKETGDTLYGRIQSYNVNSGTLSSDNEVIVLDSYDIDSTEYNTQSEEAPVQDIPAEESGSILSVIINIIMTIIRNIDVIIKSMLSIIK